METREFADRVRGCERRLYRVARTLLKNAADCEDAVQEALVKAWAKRALLRRVEYFETWLIRILINECRAIYRKRRAVEVELNERTAQTQEHNETLMDALMALPESQRVTIELHCVEGYSVREVAGILRVPEGTVKWRLKAARERLRPELEREGLL